MTEFITTEALTALLQVVLIDLVLAGDNAIVIGLLRPDFLRRNEARLFLIGIVAATILRLLLAGLATQILQIVGLLLAGGILLLWVCWKMWRELRTSSTGPTGAMDAAGVIAGRKARKTLAQKTYVCDRIKKEWPGGSQVLIRKVLPSQIQTFLSKYSFGPSSYNAHFGCFSRDV